MAASPMSEVLQHLRRAALWHDGAGLTDGQLLECFVRRGDEAAVAALVRRHGPMVWGVCRRVLSSHHDAEDAFQATFLVLVRRASSISPPERVANWLYGVAHQTALKARATVARRNERERPMARPPDAPVRPDRGHELRALLDQELSRLPDVYRAVVVLCDLEGRTRRQAALQLGVPEGTVAGRLARARALLAKRLGRHGLAVSAVGLAGWLAHGAASGGTPAGALVPTVQAATLLAAGRAAATGVVAARVAALTEGVLQAMLLNKFRTALALVFVVAVLGWGTGTMAWHARGADRASPAPTAGAGQKPKNENLKNTLLALDKHYWEATARGDWQELQKFLADDLVTVSVLGTYGKADCLESCRRHRTTEWTRREPQVVRVSKDVAVLTYLYDCKVLSADGQLLETRKDYRVMSVWANRAGGWVVVFCHDDHGRRARGDQSAISAYEEALRIWGHPKKP